MELADLCDRLRSSLNEAVRRNLAEGALLSGGLDSSIVAALASRHGLRRAFTVAYGGADAPDLRYAKLVARRFRLKHVIYCFDESEAREAARAVVKILRTFDPMEVRNSIPIYLGLKAARESGVRSMLTGDGGDELFVGYSYLLELDFEKLQQELEKLWSTMKFSSTSLGEALGIDVKLPYLDPDFKRLAMRVDLEFKVRRDRSQPWGKWILRKAFEGILPEQIVWRSKTPIEAGTGVLRFSSSLVESSSDEEFEDKARRYLENDGVVIRSKEQLFYYEIYRSTIGIPRDVNRGSGKQCPFCNSAVGSSIYCRICGAYPV